MPRRETPFVPGFYYHIYNRGNNRQNIYFQPENYVYFLRKVEKYLAPVAQVTAYCLMPTHYHILARIEDKQRPEFLENTELHHQKISNAMMCLSVSYTKAINKRFNRVGSLFQGQFQAKPVRNDVHLLNLCIYIHANPVKDRLVTLPENWPYSNYLEWLGLRNGSLVDRQFIQEHFGTPAEYRELVMHFVKTRYLPEEMSKYLKAFE